MKYTLLLLMLQPLLSFAGDGTHTVMHRRDAGNLDSHGWTSAESTNGNFSVRLPTTFNDFSVLGGAGIVRRMEVIGGKGGNGVVFSAIRYVYKAAGAASDQFEKLKHGEGLPAAHVTPLTVDGFRALEISFGAGGEWANERVILEGEDVFALMVEWPTSEQANVGQVVQPFFESFRVVPGMSTDNPVSMIWQKEQLNEPYMRSLTKEECMNKTVATISRSGCGTNECLKTIAGATGDCLTWAAGTTAKLCLNFESRFSDKFCRSEGFDEVRCGLLKSTKNTLCVTPQK